MDKRQNYNGYVVEAYPYELRAGGWSAEFYIEKHDHEGVLATQFLLNRTLPTRESVVEAAILAGRHKIDTGFVPTLAQ